jgi:hypothetical protein
MWWGHDPTSIKRQGYWLLIWYQGHLSYCETPFKGQNPLEAMWDNTSWWTYHAVNKDTLYQLMLFVETNHMLYLSPLSGGLWWGYYPISVRRRGPWLFIWHQEHLFYCEMFFKEQNSLEAIWDNTSWWAYHAINTDISH